MAISPRSTAFGVAVFQGERLLYYGLIGLWSARVDRLRNAGEKVKNLIMTYDPACLAIEKLTYPQQRSASLMRLCQKIQKVAAENNLKIISHPLGETRSYFSGGTKPTKQKTANTLAGIYPELKKHLHGQSRRQWIYGMPVLNSIALGLYSVRRHSEPLH